MKKRKKAKEMESFLETFYGDLASGAVGDFINDMEERRILSQFIQRVEGINSKMRERKMDFPEGKKQVKDFKERLIKLNEKILAIIDSQDDNLEQFFGNLAKIQKIKSPRYPRQAKLLWFHQLLQHPHLKEELLDGKTPAETEVSYKVLKDAMGMKNMPVQFSKDVAQFKIPLVRGKPGRTRGSKAKNK